MRIKKIVVNESREIFYITKQQIGTATSNLPSNLPVPTPRHRRPLIRPCLHNMNYTLNECLIILHYIHICKLHLYLVVFL